MPMRHCCGVMTRCGKKKKKKETKHQKSSPRHIWLIFIGLAAEYKDAVADGLLMSLLLSYIYFVFKQLPFWVIIRIQFKEPAGPRIINIA